jgi:hypothetical protein
MSEGSHSCSTVVLPELSHSEAVAKAWKRKFVKNAISGKPEKDEVEDKDYTEAVYDCLCDMGTSLRLLAEVITRIEDKLK